MHFKKKLKSYLPLIASILLHLFVILILLRIFNFSGGLITKNKSSDSILEFKNIFIEKIDQIDQRQSIKNKIKEIKEPEKKLPIKTSENELDSRPPIRPAEALAARKPHVNKQQERQKKQNPSKLSQPDNLLSQSDADSTDKTRQQNAILKEKLVYCYPKISQKRGEQGFAQFQVAINTLGIVETLKMTQSTGFPQLDECAKQALKNAKYYPAMHAGQPISATLIETIQFKLH